MHDDGDNDNGDDDVDDMYRLILKRNMIIMLLIYLFIYLFTQIDINITINFNNSLKEKFDLQMALQGWNRLIQAYYILFQETKLVQYSKTIQIIYAIYAINQSTYAMLYKNK